MARSLKAYFILYVISFHFKLLFSFLVCHRDQGRAQSKFQEISPSQLQRKSSKTDCKNIFSGVVKSWHLPTQGWGGIFHPMPPHGYGSAQKYFVNHSLESQKMPLCVEGKFVYMVDLRSGMENMIPLSNLCCTNLKNSSLIFKK